MFLGTHNKAFRISLMVVTAAGSLGCDQAVPAIHAFDAQPGLLPSDGGMVHLSWSASGDSIAIEPGLASLPNSGEIDVTVSASTVFVLRAKGSKGEVSQSRTVAVAVPPRTLSVHGRVVSSGGGIAGGPAGRPQSQIAVRSREQVTSTDTDGFFDFPNIQTPYDLSAESAGLRVVVLGLSSESPVVGIPARVAPGSNYQVQVSVSDADSTPGAVTYAYVLGPDSGPLDYGYQATFVATVNYNSIASTPNVDVLALRFDGDAFISMGLLKGVTLSTPTLQLAISMETLSHVAVKIDVSKPIWTKDVLFQRGLVFPERHPVAVAHPKMLSFPTGEEFFPSIPGSVNTAMFQAERVDGDAGCGCNGVSSAWGPVSTDGVLLMDVPLLGPVAGGRVSWTSPRSSACLLEFSGAAGSAFSLSVLTTRNELSLQDLDIPKGHSYLVEATCLGGFDSVDAASSDLFVSRYARDVPYQRVQTNAYQFTW